VGAEVEEFAEKLILYQHGTLDTGSEFVEWVPEEMIAMVVKGFGLEQQAKERSITIHQAMDGAQLSKKYHPCHLRLQDGGPWSILSIFKEAFILW